MIVLEDTIGKSCFIFGAGEKTSLYEKPCEGDMVIAADGGLRWLRELQIVPDYVIGDFDSLGESPANTFENASEKVVTLPCEKDTTDLYEAAEAGIRKGCKSFFIYGGTGGRLDHTLANIQLLASLAERGCDGVIFGEGYGITAVKDGKITLSGKKGEYVSVFSLSDVSEGVDLKGLKYELSDYTLRNTFPLGVSNEFTDKTAIISVRKGTLAVYYTI